MGKIQLKKYEFDRNFNPKSQGKWYARVEHYSTISSKELCQLAADDSHIERMEVEYVISAIVKQIEELVLNGHTIQIPELGHLSIGVDSKTVEDYDDVRCDTLIKQLKLNLRVTQDIRKELEKVSLRIK